MFGSSSFLSTGGPKAVQIHKCMNGYLVSHAFGSSPTAYVETTYDAASARAKALLEEAEKPISPFTGLPGNAGSDFMGIFADFAGLPKEKITEAFKKRFQEMVGDSEDPLGLKDLPGSEGD